MSDADLDVDDDPGQKESLSCSSSVQPNAVALTCSSSVQPNAVALKGDCFIEFEDLKQQADQNVVANERVFNEIGMHCQIMDKAHSDLGSLVHKLRDDRVKLADFASFNVAKVFMRDKHPEVNPSLSTSSSSTSSSSS
jgi:hypothetical protein